MNKDDESVSYNARFNKSTRLLSVTLNYRPLEEIVEERRIQEIESEKSEQRLKAQREDQLDRHYELKKDLKQKLYLGTNTVIKGKRKLNSLTIGLLDRDKYKADRKLRNANLFEDDTRIGIFNADFRVIRALFSGQKLYVIEHKIERERSLGETLTTIYFTVSPNE